MSVKYLTAVNFASKIAKKKLKKFCTLLEKLNNFVHAKNNYGEPHF